ncbi:MAG: helix-turn-helix transcriptional regulator [Curvibacter sp.]|nr:helix-turn-helix transcriptional regulator [Curvibacter sp.]
MSALCRAFGRVLRQRREQAGWSQELLAEKADLNRSYIGELERGQAVPSLITLEKLAAALELSPSYLLAQAERAAQKLHLTGLELTSIAC